MNISIKRIVYTCFVLFFLLIPQASALEIISFDGLILINGDLDVTIEYELSNFEELIVITPLKSERDLISKELRKLGNDNELISLDDGKARVLISGFADINQNGEYDTQPFSTDETIRDISLSFPDGWTYEKQNDNRVPQLIHKPDTTTALTFDSNGNEVTVYLKSPYITDEQKKELIFSLNQIYCASKNTINYESKTFNEINANIFTDTWMLTSEIVMDVIFLEMDIYSGGLGGFEAKEILAEPDTAKSIRNLDGWDAVVGWDAVGWDEVTEVDALWTVLSNNGVSGANWRIGIDNIASDYIHRVGENFLVENGAKILNDNIIGMTKGILPSTSPLNDIDNLQTQSNENLILDLVLLIYSSDITDEQYKNIKNVLELRLAEMNSVRDIPLIEDDFAYLPTDEYMKIYDNTHRSVDAFDSIQTGINVFQTLTGTITGGDNILAKGIDTYSKFDTNQRVIYCYYLINSNAYKSSAYRILETGDITRSTYITVSDIITKQRPIIDPVEEIQGSFYNDIYSNTSTDYYVHIFFNEDELKRLLDKNHQKATIKAGYLFKNNENYVLITEIKEINKIPDNGELDIHIEEQFYGKPGNYDVVYVVEITTDSYNKIYTAPKNNINVKDFPLEVDFDFKYLPLETGNVLSQSAVLTFKNTGSRQIVIDSVDEINGFATYESGTKHTINLQSDGFMLGPHDEYNVYLNFPTVIFTPFPDGIKDYKVEAIYKVNGIGFTTTHESQQ